MVIVKDKITQVKRFASVRYLKDNGVELYKKFEFKRKLCMKTFLKYKKLSKIYKKSHRLTDICEYCEAQRQIKFNLKKKIKDFGNVIQIPVDPQKVIDMIDMIQDPIRYQFEEMLKEFKIEFDLIKESTILNDFEKKEKLNYIANIMIDLKNIERIEFHKFVANSQREAYNKQRKDKELLRRKILIDVDWKQKIVVGGAGACSGPRQINKEYYTQTTNQRTCLGIFYFKMFLNF